MIDWVLFLLLGAFGLSFIVVENKPVWIQLSVGLPAAALALAIFARKLHPKLFSAEDTLQPWKQYTITLAVVVALIAVIGGGAWYLDTYHHPGREMTATETYLTKIGIYFVIGVPIVLAFLFRQLLKRKMLTGSATEVVPASPTIERRLGPQ